MKIKFLRKEAIFVILSLSLSIILIGCSAIRHNDSNDKNKSSILQSGEKEIQKDSSKEENSTEKLDEDENDVSSETHTVIGTVELYEGIYFDDRRFGDREVPLKTSCEVVISNITDTSFDFTVYEVDEKTQEKKVIFLTNTAVFEGDGTEATFSGKEYTLHFTFPDYHSAYPVVTDMEITGFEPLEGKTYVNNGIPGHEFGQVKNNYNCSLPVFYGQK